MWTLTWETAEMLGEFTVEKDETEENEYNTGQPEHDRDYKKARQISLKQ